MRFTMLQVCCIPHMYDAISMVCTEVDLELDHSMCGEGSLLDVRAMTNVFMRVKLSQHCLWS